MTKKKKNDEQKPWGCTCIGIHLVSTFVATLGCPLFSAKLHPFALSLFILGQGWTFLFLPICCGWLAARFPPQLPPTPPASQKKKSNRCRIFVHILLRPWKRNCLIFPLPVCLPPSPLLSRVSPPQRTYPAPAPCPVSKRGCCFWFSCTPFPPHGCSLSLWGVCWWFIWRGFNVPYWPPGKFCFVCYYIWLCRLKRSFPFPPNPSLFFPPVLWTRERERAPFPLEPRYCLSVLQWGSLLFFVEVR